MQYFPIRTFSGIETRISATRQDRGTLRRAEGVLTIPRNALSSGPEWFVPWGMDNFADAVDGLMIEGDRVEFVTLSRGSHTFLIAWDFANVRAQGMWHVAGNGDPQFGETGGVILASAGSVYGTEGRRWFGSWLGDRLFLGNGADPNLVWHSGGLRIFGPGSEPADPRNPSRFRIPPCTSAVIDRRGHMFVAGNDNHPLRVWIADPPTSTYPFNEGVQNLDRSFKDLTQAEGSRITSLSLAGANVVCHMPEGAIALRQLEKYADGWRAAQRPLAVYAGAASPDCGRDIKQGPFYLGQDREIYRVQALVGEQQYNEERPRDAEIATNRSSGEWNRDMLEPDGDEFIVFNESFGQLWLWARTKQGGRAAWCYNLQHFAVTGPFRWPPLLAGAQVRGSSWMAGITPKGRLLASDLTAIGEQFDESGDIESPPDAPQAIEPDTPCWAGVHPDTGSFVQSIEGEAIGMGSPWKDWSSELPDVWQYFPNATVAIIEMAEQDFGSPAALKNFLEIKVQWQRNAKVHCGVWAESDGQRDGQWIGQAWPNQEQRSFINITGTRLRVRIIAVFTGQRAVLPDVTIGFLPGVPR